MPYFASRGTPHTYFVNKHDDFADVVDRALDELRLMSLGKLSISNRVEGSSEFQSLPSISGPGAMLNLS